MREAGWAVVRLLPAMKPSRSRRPGPALPVQRAVPSAGPAKCGVVSNAAGSAALPTHRSPAGQSRCVQQPGRQSPPRPDTSDKAKRSSPDPPQRPAAGRPSSGNGSPIGRGIGIGRIRTSAKFIPTGRGCLICLASLAAVARGFLACPALVVFSSARRPDLPAGRRKPRVRRRGGSGRRRCQRPFGRPAHRSRAT